MYHEPHAFPDKSEWEPHFLERQKQYSGEKDYSPYPIKEGRQRSGETSALPKNETASTFPIPRVKKNKKRKSRPYDLAPDSVDREAEEPSKTGFFTSWKQHFPPIVHSTLITVVILGILGLVVVSTSRDEVEWGSFFSTKSGEDSGKPVSPAPNATSAPEKGELSQSELLLHSKNAVSKNANDEAQALTLPSPTVEETARLQQQLQESQRKIEEQEKQHQKTLREREQQYAKRLVTETMLRESLVLLGNDETKSILIALKAAQMYKELGQNIPEVGKTILAQAYGQQSLGESLADPIAEIETMTISPSGNWLLTGNADRGVWLWDLSKAGHTTDAGYRLDALTVPVTKLAFTPNERWVIGARSDGYVQYWNVTLEQPADSSNLLHEKIPGLKNIEVSPDGNWLIAYGGANTPNNGSPTRAERPSAEANVVLLWNISSLQRGIPRAMVLRGHERPVRCAAISPDSRWLATGGEDRIVRLYDLKSPQPAVNQRVFSGHQLEVTDLQFAADGQWVASGSRDNTVRVWKLTETANIPNSLVLQGHNGWISALAASSDGKWLATAGYDRTVRLWNMQNLPANPTENDSIVLKSDQGNLKKMAFSPDASLLITQGTDSSVRTWDLAGEQRPGEQSVILKGEVSSFALEGKSRWLILAASHSPGKSGIRLWPLKFDDLLACSTRYSKTSCTPEQTREAEVYARQLQQKFLR